MYRPAPYSVYVLHPTGPISLIQQHFENCAQHFENGGTQQRQEDRVPASKVLTVQGRKSQHSRCTAMEVREGVDETKELGDGILGRRTSECKGREAKKQNQAGNICKKKKKS